MFVTEVSNIGSIVMLIDFTFSNSSSFLDETFISLESGERLRKYNKENTIYHHASGTRILKSALIFGANASGKSNLLSALNMMKLLILNPTVSSKQKLPSQHYLMSSVADETPTTLAIKFIIHDITYNFSISFLQNKYIQEKLTYKYPNEQEKIHYSFDNRDQIEGFPHRENFLHAHYLDDKGDQHIKNLIEWFDDYLVIFDHNTDFNELNRIIEEEKYRKALLTLLKCADNNIIDIQIVADKIKIPEKLKKLLTELSNAADIPNSQISHRLHTLYNKYDGQGNIVGTTKISVENLESTGTKHFIRLALLMLKYHNGNRVIVMDEFNDSFHLELSKAVMKLIHSHNNKNQFLLTTHELQLLDCDLRVDQIYLLEKDFQGKSNIYSLFDFSELKGVRGDISYFRRYLQGQFGAIPSINIKGMLNVFQEIQE